MFALEVPFADPDLLDLDDAQDTSSAGGPPTSGSVSSELGAELKPIESVWFLSEPFDPFECSLDIFEPLLEPVRLVEALFEPLEPTLRARFKATFVPRY